MPETRNIAIMVDPLNGYREKLLTGISRYASRNPGWRIAFFDRERRDLADLIATWQGDGIICSALTPSFAEAARQRDIPIVNVTSRLTDPAFTNVVSDDVQVGEKAAAFLLARGFRSFAFLRGRDNSLHSLNRAKGFTNAISAAGLTLSSIAIGNSDDQELADWLAPLPRPIAILGATDRLAAMLIEACWKLGLRVPQEVAVLGIGNYDQLCNLCSPSLSSVDVDMERRGYDAANWIDQILDGLAPPAAPILIPPAFVAERASTDVYAFDDPDVVNALRFIHDHASQSIKVTQVVAATTISRRSLEGRFNRLIGRTLHDEIWRAHFDLATRLLTSSDLSLQEVAERSGFRTASALVNLFRQRFGITPKEYRIANRR